MSYRRYALERLLVAALLLIGTSLVLFAMLRLLPGDPAQVILGLRYTPEAAAAISERLGLDEPLPVQYLRWIGRAVQGDLGQDYRSNRPIGQILRQRLPVTLELALLAMAFAVAIALFVGVAAVALRNRWGAWASEALSTLGMSLPEFWLGIMLILFFAEQLRWLPPSGFVAPGEDLGENLRRMLLPSLTLAIGLAAVLLRFLDSGLRQALRQDYIRSARARGVAERTVVAKHALKNAALPVVTVVGLQFGYLLGGAVIVEEVFSLPGLGRLVVAAVTERNYLVAQAAILVVVAMFVTVNLVVDLLYGLLDPRIQARSG